MRVNNQTKDVTRKNSIPASNHFDTEGHKFNIHGKFLLIEQLKDTINPLQRFIFTNVIRCSRLSF